MVKLRRFAGRTWLAAAARQAAAARLAAAKRLAAAGIMIVVFLVSGCRPVAEPAITTIGLGGPDQAAAPAAAGRINIAGVEEVGRLKVDSRGWEGDAAAAGPDQPAWHIQIPAGAYSEPRDIVLKRAEIRSHSFGPAFNPISPLISFEDGGAPARLPVRLRIAVETEESKLAMAFFYDQAAGRLEGAPVIGQDENSITIATRFLKPLVICSFSTKELKNDIDSGFQPGRDDWQMADRGTFAFPAGQPAGLSLTALWYFEHRPDGLGTNLYGRYDNNGREPATPGFAPDDASIYRLAAGIQHDLDWASLSAQWQPDWATFEANTARNLAAAAMRLTGQPQWLVLTSSQETRTVIAYHIDGSRIYISDPEYPGDSQRCLNLEQDRLEPYHSLTTGGSEVIFNGLAYAGSYAWLNPSTLARRWQELREGRTGEDLFPAYRLVYLDESGRPQELFDGMVWPQSKIYIGVQIGVEAGVIIYRDDFREGAALPRDTDGRIDLQPGVNHLGIYVAKQSENGDVVLIDFRYLDVDYRR